MDNIILAGLAARQQAICDELLSLWYTKPASQWYAVQCPCMLDCCCMSDEECPRLQLNHCNTAADLNYLVVTQPFLENYNFSVVWQCLECLQDLACGNPAF